MRPLTLISNALPTSLLNTRSLARKGLLSRATLAIRRHLLTLAIESSCDDTAVAIVEKNGSSASIHFNERITADQGPLRGIHPIVSLESHEQVLAKLVQASLHKLPAEERQGNSESHNGSALSGKRLPDFISVTRGPGLRSNLNTGINLAKGLAIAWAIPLVGIHHMQAHALTPRLDAALHQTTHNVTEPDFPFLSLLVSGGHTLLVRSRSLETHDILVNTSDYAVGDCLDKAARFILPERVLESATSTSYGPVLEHFAFPAGEEEYHYRPPTTSQEEVKQASEPSSYGWAMPQPYITSRGGRQKSPANFSFTGIESQASRIAQFGWNMSTGKLNRSQRTGGMMTTEAKLLAQETMRVCFQHIASRILSVLEKEEAETGNYCKTLVISGGVASNKYLRHVVPHYLQARGKPIDKILAPPVPLCTDNAAMIGWAGCEMFEAGHRNDLCMKGLGKWSLENLLHPERERDFVGWLEKNT